MGNDPAPVPAWSIHDRPPRKGPQPDPDGAPPEAPRRRYPGLGWLLAMVLGSGFVAALGGFFIDPTPNRRITHASFAAIRLGMSRREVHSLLGPPGVYCQPLPRRYVQLRGYLAMERCESVGRAAHPDSSDQWESDYCGIEVAYDANGRVVSTVYEPQTIRYKWWGWVLHDTRRWSLKGHPWDED